MTDSVSGTPAETGLKERMNLTWPGQVTWARPELGRHCGDCRFFEPENADSIDGRCSLVRAITRRRGDLLDGRRAIACGKFERKGDSR